MSYNLVKFAYEHGDAQHTFFLVLTVKESAAYLRRKDRYKVHLGNDYYVPCTLVSVKKISKSAADAVKSTINNEEFYQHLLGLPSSSKQSSSKKELSVAKTSSVKAIPDITMDLTLLPLDIFQLIVLELSNEEIQALSLTSQTMSVLLRQLFCASWFWKNRYERLTKGSHCSVDCLLPEFITHYGWYKLYWRYTNFVSARPTDVDCYFDPTGNFYIKFTDVYCFVRTFSIREVFWLQRKGDKLLIVYLSLTGTVEWWEGIIDNNTVNFSYWALFSDVINHHMDEHLVVCLTKDGAVYCICGPAKVWQEPTLDKSRTFTRTAPTESGYKVGSRFTLFIDIFQVRYLVQTLDDTWKGVFTWKRGSPERLQCMAEEIQRMLQLQDK